MGDYPLAKTSFQKPIYSSHPSKCGLKKMLPSNAKITLRRFIFVVFSLQIFLFLVSGSTYATLYKWGEINVGTSDSQLTEGLYKVFLDIYGTPQENIGNFSPPIQEELLPNLRGIYVFDPEDKLVAGNVARKILIAAESFAYLKYWHVLENRPSLLTLGFDSLKKFSFYDVFLGRDIYYHSLNTLDNIFYTSRLDYYLYVFREMVYQNTISRENNISARMRLVVDAVDKAGSVNKLSEAGVYVYSLFKQGAPAIGLILKALKSGDGEAIKSMLNLGDKSIGEVLNGIEDIMKHVSDTRAMKYLTGLNELISKATDAAKLVPTGVDVITSVLVFSSEVDTFNERVNAIERFLTTKSEVINGYDPHILGAFYNFKADYDDVNSYIISKVVTVENIESLTDIVMGFVKFSNPVGLAVWVCREALFELIEDVNGVYYITASYTVLKLLQQYLIDQLSKMSSTSEINYEDVLNILSLIQVFMAQSYSIDTTFEDVTCFEWLSPSDWLINFFNLIGNGNLDEICSDSKYYKSEVLNLLSITSSSFSWADMIHNLNSGVIESPGNFNYVSSRIRDKNLIYANPALDKDLYETDDYARLIVTPLDKFGVFVDGVHINYRVIGPDDVVSYEGSILSCTDTYCQDSFPVPDSSGSYSVEVVAYKEGYQKVDTTIQLNVENPVEGHDLAVVSLAADNNFYYPGDVATLSTQVRNLGVYAESPTVVFTITGPNGYNYQKSIAVETLQAGQTSGVLDVRWNIPADAAGGNYQVQTYVRNSTGDQDYANNSKSVNLGIYDQATGLINDAYVFTCKTMTKDQNYQIPYWNYTGGWHTEWNAPDGHKYKIEIGAYREDDGNLELAMNVYKDGQILEPGYCMSGNSVTYFTRTNYASYYDDYNLIIFDYSKFETGGDPGFSLCLGVPTSDASLSPFMGMGYVNKSISFTVNLPSGHYNSPKVLRCNDNEQPVIEANQVLTYFDLPELASGSFVATALATSLQDGANFAIIVYGGPDSSYVVFGRLLLQDFYDARIGNITLDPLNPTVGTQVVISQNINNTGSVDLTGIEVYATINGPNDYQVTFNSTTDGGNVKFLWDTSGCPSGEYTVRGTIYHPNDMDNSNNSKTANINLGEPASLQLTVSLNKSIYTEGEEALITATTSPNAIVTYEVLDENDNNIGGGVLTDSDNDGDYAANFSTPMLPSEYTVRVIASKSGYLESDSTVHFTVNDTEPPTVPLLVYPFSDSSIKETKPTLDWTDSIDFGNGQVSYQIEISQLPDFSSLIVQENITDSFYTVKAALGEGEYFWRVQAEDANGNRSVWSNTGSFIVDITSPTSGSIEIDEGVASTDSLIVTLDNLAAQDNLSPIVSMQFSNDGSTWSPEEKYNSVRNGWDLSLYGGNSEPGIKTVFVKFKDEAGNWSEAFSDTIEYVIPKIAYVATDGDCGGNSPCFHSIQEAIASVSEGGIIEVAEGVYHENIMIDGSKKLSIEGGWDPSFSRKETAPTLTVIDGDLKGSVIKIVPGEGDTMDIAIDGITIQNGEASNGAGIFAENATLKISNSLIHSNHVTECVGAGLDLINCHIELTGNEIFDNHNDQGGGAGIAVSGNCTGFIKNCSIHDNVIERFGCTQWDGGGILIHSSTIHLDGNKIYNNHAGYGGGIAVDFRQNSLITNNIIWNNTANYGGGLFIAHDSSAPQVINNTIYGNRTTYSGDGVEVWGGTSPIFMNCIIWGNGENNFSGASVTFSDIEDEYSGDGNISQPPHLADPDGPDGVLGTKDDDFHLLFDSPCVDSGSNASISGRDFELDKRPIDGNMDGTKICDMGADEFKLYEYWFPWASNETWWTNNQQASTIDVVAVQNDTKVFIDSNFDGILNGDEIYLNISSPDPTPKHLITDLDPPIGYGVKILSNKPISCWYERRNNNWTEYDDEMLMYTPPPLGKLFVVPFAGTISCVATQDNTIITTPTGVYTLLEGENVSFEGHSGDQIESNLPIAVSLHTVDRSNMDSTLATGIYPVSYFGKEFYVLNKFKTNYPGEVDHRKLFIVYSDGSYEARDLPGTPCDQPITSRMILQEKGFVYYKFDVEDDSGRHFTYAYPILPANALGTDYAYGGSIISTANNNNIYMDSDYDGVFDKIISLNAGGTYNLPYRVSKNGYNSLMTRANVGRIHSDYPVFVFYVGLVASWRDDACMSRTISPLPVVPEKLLQSADMDKDGDVDGMDLLTLASEIAKGTCSAWNPCLADLNADGKADAHDLEKFAKQYGLASSSELGVMTSNVLSFSCFGDNCGHPDSCCFNEGGDHCNSYNEGIFTIPQIINPGNIARAEISLVNVNTQGSSNRFLDYFLSLQPDAQNSGLTLLSDHRVPGFSELRQDPLVIDVTDALISLGPSPEYYFGVLNDDYWEVTVSDIMLRIKYVASSH